MPEASASDALREALIDLSPVLHTADIKLLAPLQKMVCGVVDELKPTGMPPERVLLAIKEIAQQAGVAPAGNRLVEQMVKWCLERYFAKPAA
jgi:hypothetical protein